MDRDVRPRPRRRGLRRGDLRCHKLQGPGLRVASPRRKVGRRLRADGAHRRTSGPRLKLPSKQRAALAWNLDGFTTEESARAMGTTQVAVRQNLSRARTALKRSSSFTANTRTTKRRRENHEQRCTPQRCRRAQQHFGSLAGLSTPGRRQGSPRQGREAFLSFGTPTPRSPACSGRPTRQPAPQ
ncbi:sigma factor-like helix-turn-helix DNA-binding protein [Streptomyces nojiriensis]|uniref:sigma-70 region 4 domain-containing protein n=1 Tax=Streptomyces nojiriensis TaxID=66374 RepID=UPI0036DDDBE6